MLEVVAAVAAAAAAVAVAAVAVVAVASVVATERADPHKDTGHCWRSSGIYQSLGAARTHTANSHSCSRRRQAMPAEVLPMDLGTTSRTAHDLCSLASLSRPSRGLSYRQRTIRSQSYRADVACRRVNGACCTPPYVWHAPTAQVAPTEFEKLFIPPGFERERDCQLDAGGASFWC